MLFLSEKWVATPYNISLLLSAKLESVAHLPFSISPKQLKTCCTVAILPVWQKPAGKNDLLVELIIETKSRLSPCYCDAHSTVLVHLTQVFLCYTWLGWILGQIIHTTPRIILALLLSQFSPLFGKTILSNLCPFFFFFFFPPEHSFSPFPLFTRRRQSSLARRRRRRRQTNS